MVICVSVSYGHFGGYLKFLLRKRSLFFAGFDSVDYFPHATVRDLAIC